jgi:phosphoribosylanthranilate isomerase
LKTIVKASGISNLTDARYFSAWEVQYLGFNLDKTSGQPLGYAEAGAIREWLEGPDMIGEFGLEPAENILRVVREQKLNGAQVSMMYQTEALKRLKDLFVIQEIIFEAEPDLKAAEQIIMAHSPYTQMFLLDFDRNGLDWNTISQQKPEILRWIKSISDSASILLSLRFPVDALGEVLSKTGVKGISLAGGEEEKVGYKSFEDLDEIFEALSQ